MPVAATQRPSGATLLFFAAVTVLYCVWVLLLPIFPSQDGPMHLFYTQIFSQLLFHPSSSIYGQYYYIRHILPPYSLYYYLLILFSRVAPLIWADKLTVALAILNLAFGLRRLCMALGRNGQAVAFLGLPLLLSWPLFMGFVNFILSLGMGAWALALWTELEERPSAARRAAFAFLLAAMTLTHPVPVGLVLVFCMVDLAFRAIGSWSSWLAGGWRRWLGDLILAGVVGAGCAVFVSAFTVKHIAQQRAPEWTLGMIFTWLPRLHGLIFCGGVSPSVLLYRLCAYLILLLPLAIALRAAFRRGPKAAAAPQRMGRWLTLALVLLVALPFIPADLNGSHFFRDRLVIAAWIAALAAASAAPELSRRALTALAGFGAAAGLITLLAAQQNVRPVAVRIAQIERMPIPPHGPVALLLMAENEHFQRQLFFEAYEWVGAHYVRRAHSVLLNSPWLDLPILPIGARKDLLNGEIPVSDVDVTQSLRADLQRSPALRKAVYSRVNYALLVDQTVTTPASPPDPVLAADEHGRWSCRRQDWLLICDRQPVR